MEKFSSTRINLLFLNTRLLVLKSGAKLLRSKREALMKDFFRCVGECLELRTKLNSQIRDAAYGLHLARAFLGDALYSTAYASKRDISLDIKVKNIWGINVPSIEQKAFVRTMDARDISPVGEGTLAIEAAKGFEKVMDAVVTIASCEIRLKRVGEEIRADTRKINALEEILVPSIKNGIKTIERALEEREREDIYRLKRYKRRQEAIGNR
ncbi:MAG: V-type ATP synthase subunit D [Deltaproteobacteria bacterium]|nr:V-type ATP synthase subunit D [Deltaproteobacteria bacterium]